MAVLDASVVLKWFFLDEEGSPQALRLRDAHVSGKGQIAVPDLLLYEVANVLRFKSEAALKEADDALTKLSNIDMQIFPPDVDILKRAMEISRDYGISVYDGSYVALAEKLKCLFITADHKLLSRLKKLNYVHHLAGSSQ